MMKSMLTSLCAMFIFGAVAQAEEQQVEQTIVLEQEGVVCEPELEVKAQEKEEAPSCQSCEQIDVSMDDQDDDDDEDESVNLKRLA